MKKIGCINRGDWLCGGLAALISFIVYAWTVAPSVTLLDSGEFITAATHFGVPHPPGYPLWTLLTWLFTLLPLGNAAWEVNIFSGICASIAIGLCAAMGRGSLRWLFSPADARLASVCSLAGALLLAFSFSVWSQAVIAEVYSLHILLIALYALALHAWIRDPESIARLLIVFFVLTLSFANHQLTIILVPLPFLAVLLVRRELLPDVIAAVLTTGLLVYGAFAWLSGDVALVKTATRLAYCVIAAVTVFLIIRRGSIRWRLMLLMPVAVIFGLLPLAYMPLASATNPPMNWSYAKEPAGFYKAINRSQYQGSLAELSLRTIGTLMGSKPEMRKPANSEPPPLFLKAAQAWTGFFWLKLLTDFTPLSVIAYFAAFIAALRSRDVARRTWIYVLHIAFALAGFLQPVMDRTSIDASTWWLQMPFHGYTYFFYALICITGGYYVLATLIAKLPKARPVMYATLLLPLVPLYLNYGTAGQRDHWFGWQFGHDLLSGLPKNAVLFGGTDAGRFVPTYMIFGESPQDAKYKRDPEFDRRDLYIITQNAVGEERYAKYILDQYGQQRPQAKGAFEKWLGRESTYPKEPLVLPTWEETRQILRDAEEKNPNVTQSELQSTVAKWIWEKNKGTHPFFVEESFPLKWSYDNAIPHGLVYEIAPEKLESLPRDVVDKDFAFWNAYIPPLIKDPKFLDDFDAQRAFSKLRVTTGNIYKHRNMDEAAKLAYRQSLALFPTNLEAIVNLMTILWDEGKFDEAIKLVEQAIPLDPDEKELWRYYSFAVKRKEVEQQINALKAALQRNPADEQALERLVTTYSELGEYHQAQPILEKALTERPNDAVLLRFAISYFDSQEIADRRLDVATKLASMEPNDAQIQYVLARARLVNGDDKGFYEAARKAVELGGVEVREALQQDAAFERLRDKDEFRELIGLPAELKQ
jgi:tetratricopeptide (TPR) repeat protein